MKKRIIKLLVITVSVLALLFFQLILLEKIHYKCFYQELFNITCPGCGTTRMLKSIYELEFYQAFRYNPLMFILLIVSILFCIVNAIRYLQNKKLVKISNKVLIGLAFLLIIYMILRNIPCLDFLKPTEVI